MARKVRVEGVMNFKNGKEVFPFLAKVMSDFKPETLDSSIVNTPVGKNERR